MRKFALPLPLWLHGDRGLCRPCARLLPLCSACGALCNLARRVCQQVAQEVRRVHVQRGTDLRKLDHVQPALPRFVLAYKRLGLVELLRQVLLCYPIALAGSA